MHISVATNNLYFFPSLPFYSNVLVDVGIFCGKNGTDSHSCGTSECVFWVTVHCRNFVLKSDLSSALVFTKIDNYKNRSQL
jgi:hypothetical protein